VSAEVEGDKGDSLAEGFIRENPRVSVDTVTLTGPSLEINKIVSVKAVVSLTEELSSTQTLEATIVPVGATDKQTFTNVKFESDEPVYVTVPVTFSAEYKPTVTFTNMPAAILAQVLIIVVLGYVSGCFYPESFFPEAVNRIAKALPIGAGFSFVKGLLADEPTLWDTILVWSYTVAFLGITAVCRRRKIAGDM